MVAPSTDKSWLAIANPVVEHYEGLGPNVYVLNGVKIAKPYVCPAGKLTHGYGIVMHDIDVKKYLNGTPIATAIAILTSKDKKRIASFLGTLPGITEAVAHEQCLKKLDEFEDQVSRELKEATTPNRLAALVCFAYNIGMGQWHPKVDGFRTSSVLRLHNEGKFSDASKWFAPWCHGDGAVLPGLVARRAGEAFLYNGGTIEKLRERNFFQ